MVNSPLIRPAISWGGSFGGGTLDSHETMSFFGHILGLVWFQHPEVQPLKVEPENHPEMKRTII